MFVCFALILLPSLIMGQQEDKPLFSFDKGGIGVNFLGFNARAGLGGLLTGNAADGGLHAEAGTPFGQRAAAGLGGGVDANGKSAGGLYAGATAGRGIGAAAGLGGVASESGSFGGSFAGAESPGHETYITKIGYSPNHVRTLRIPVESEASDLSEPVEKVRVVERTRVHGRRRPHTHTTVRVENIGNTEGETYYTNTVTKPTNPQLINDIFNIPISTLKAVQQLVSGLGEGSSGSIRGRIVSAKY